MDYGNRTARPFTRGASRLRRRWQIRARCARGRHRCRMQIRVHLRIHGAFARSSPLDCVRLHCGDCPVTLSSRRPAALLLHAISICSAHASPRRTIRCCPRSPRRHVGRISTPRCEDQIPVQSGV